METPQPAFTKLTDLSAERLGGKALSCSDDFLLRKKTFSNREEEFSFLINILRGANGWMDGNHDESERQGMIGV